MSPSAKSACGAGALSRRLVLGALVAAALLSGGCSLTKPAPVKRTFLLEPPAPAAVAAPKPGTLRVGTFSVGEAYRDRAFVYRTSDLKFESDFYHEFFVAPGPMIAAATSRALTAAKVFANVMPAGPAPEEGDYVLEAFVTDLYADARVMGKAEAEIAITFYLSKLSFPTTVVWTKSYRQRVPLTANTPDALAAAWNTGLATILADLVRDLATAELKRP